MEPNLIQGIEGGLDSGRVATGNRTHNHHAKQLCFLVSLMHKWQMNLGDGMSECLEEDIAQHLSFFLSSSAEVHVESMCGVRV